MRCRYLRAKNKCYVTGRYCDTMPEECPLAAREYMILDEAEEECMIISERYICRDCGREFARYGVEMVVEEDEDGHRTGHFICADCARKRESK